MARPKTDTERVQRSDHKKIENVFFFEGFLVFFFMGGVMIVNCGNWFCLGNN